MVQAKWLKLDCLMCAMFAGGLLCLAHRFGGLRAELVPLGRTSYQLDVLILSTHYQLPITSYIWKTSELKMAQANAGIWP